MLITVSYNGKKYVDWSVDDLKASGVPQSVIDTALIGSKWDETYSLRDTKLFETDWTQSQDSPLSPEKMAEFAVYRQALRDIPQSYMSPDDVVWPPKPSLS